MTKIRAIAINDIKRGYCQIFELYEELDCFITNSPCIALEKSFVYGNPVFIIFEITGEKITQIQ